MINNALILVGGYGKRLGLITKKTPKPLINFFNKPFLDYLIEEIIKLKPKQIFLLCSYKKNFFIKKYKNKYKNTPVKIIIEKKPLGTGGAIHNSKKFITDKTLICNGDTFFEANKIKIKKNSKIQMFINKNINYKSNKKLNNLNINSKNKIYFSNKSNLMNSGIYIVNKKLNKFLKNKVNSFEDDILPNLINSNLMFGKIYKGKHFDIGTKKNITIFKKYIKNRN